MPGMRIFPFGIVGGFGKTKAELARFAERAERLTRSISE
jgi:hypothetical protein